MTMTRHRGPSPQSPTGEGGSQAKAALRGPVVAFVKETYGSHLRNSVAQAHCGQRPTPRPRLWTGLTWTLDPHSGLCRGGGLYRTLPAGGASCGGNSPSMAGPTASIGGSLSRAVGASIWASCSEVGAS